MTLKVERDGLQKDLERANTTITNYSKTIMQLYNILYKHSSERYDAQKIQALCMLEGKQLEHNKAVAESNKVEAVTASKKMLMTHRSLLSQQEKDQEVIRHRKKRQFEVDMKGTHVNAIVNDVKNNPTGRFDAMNAPLPPLPNVANAATAASMASSIDHKNNSSFEYKI